MLALKQHQGRVKPFYLVLVLIISLLSAGFYWLSGEIDQQQDAIALWVGEKLGHQVDINQAKLTWIDLSPKLELASVKVLEEDGLTQLLSLDKLYLDLDVYDSIRYGGVRLDDITISGLKVGITRDNTGALALKGLNQQGDSTLLVTELLARSKTLNSIHLNGITVDFIDQQRESLSGRYLMNDAVVQHQSNKWQANGQIKLPASLGQGVQFTGNWLLNESKPELTTWQWTVDVNALQLASLHETLVFKNVMLKQGRIDMATVRVEGIGTRLNKAELALDLSHGQLANSVHNEDSSSVIIDRLTGHFDWQQHQQGWTLAAKQLNLEVNGRRWPQSSVAMRHENVKISASGDFMRIDDLMTIITLSGELPEQLSAQSPKGELRNYQFDYNPASGIEFANFQLTKGQLSSWQDYPGIDNLNASVNIDMTQKMADFTLASEQVTLSPATWLKSPIFFDEVTGRVQLAYVPTRQQWVMKTRALALKNADLSLNLDGDIVKLDDGNILNDLSLTLDNIAIARWQSYFPEKLLGKKFKKWASEAFLAGQINHGEIKLRGDLAAFPYQSPKDKARGAFEMDLALEGVQLHYADNWPDLFDVTGRMTGQGNNVKIKTEQGSIAGFAFKDVTVDIKKLIEDKPILTVAGQLTGTTQKALNFLTNSPLKKRFGSVSTAVLAKGNSKVSLRLRVPLANTMNTDVAGDVTFLGNTLYKKNKPALAIEQVRGQLDFDNKGVTSDNLKGEFLNQTVNVALFPRQAGTAIIANGHLPSQALRKIFPDLMPNFAEGISPYKLEVLVSERGIGNFYTDATLTSNLEGMALLLPPPFDKSASQTKQVELVFNQGAKQPRYALKYDHQVALVLTEDSENNTAAIDASLPAVNAEEWLTWATQFGGQDKSSFGKLVNVTLNTDELTGFGQQLSAVSIAAQHYNKRWKIDIVSPQALGTITIPETVSNSNKLAVDLDKLMLTLPKKTSLVNTKRAALWPAMTVSIDNLSIAGKGLGVFSLQAYTDNNAWIIEQGQLNSSVYQATIIGGGWSQQGPSDKTELTIVASSNDFAGMLDKFGYQQAIAAEEAELNLALSWPSSPTLLSAQFLNGSLAFKLKKGKLNEVEAGAAGRVFGLMSVAAIPRRLALDFNELFGKGLSFRSIKGDFVITKGQAITDNLKLKSEVAEIVIQGPVDLVTQQYDQTVKVTPNVSSTLPLAGALAFGPYGLGFGTAILLVDKVAEKLFDKDIINLVSYNYTLTGSWTEPDLQAVGMALPE